ncbi:MAG: 50S ribosomal protein L37ae [Candidatus Pacearchaeota archaeon]
MPKEKKIIRKFGPRYGTKVKAKWYEIEKKQREKQKCPYCKKLRVRRIAKGIWLCDACKKKFTAGAYFTNI